MAAGAGAHAARVPQRSQGSAERPEGDLPGQRGAPSSGTATVQAAQRRLEGQVFVTDQL